MTEKHYTMIPTGLLLEAVELLHDHRDYLNEYSAWNRVAITQRQAHRVTKELEEYLHEHSAEVR